MDNQQPSSRRRPLDRGEDNGRRLRRSSRIERRTNDDAAEEVPPQQQQQPPIIEGNIPQQQPVVEDNVHADAPAVENNLQPPALQPPAPVAVDDIQLPPPLPPQQVDQQQIDVMNAERPISTHLSTLRDGDGRLLTAGTTPSIFSRATATLRASRTFRTRWGQMFFDPPQGNHPTNCRILTCPTRCTANIVIPMNPGLTTLNTSMATIRRVGANQSVLQGVLAKDAYQEFLHHSQCPNAQMAGVTNPTTKSMSLYASADLILPNLSGINTSNEPIDAIRINYDAVRNLLHCSESHLTGVLMRSDDLLEYYELLISAFFNNTLVEEGVSVSRLHDIIFPDWFQSGYHKGIELRRSTKWCKHDGYAGSSARALRCHPTEIDNETNQLLLLTAYDQKLAVNRDVVKLLLVVLVLDVLPSIGITIPLSTIPPGILPIGGNDQVLTVDEVRNDHLVKVTTAMSLVDEMILTQGSEDWSNLIDLLDGKGHDDTLNRIVSGTTTFEATECVDLFELLKFPQGDEGSRVTETRPAAGSREMAFIATLNLCLRDGVVEGIASGTKFQAIIPKCIGRVGRHISTILYSLRSGAINLPVNGNAKYYPSNNYTNLEKWKIVLLLLDLKNDMLNPPQDEDANEEAENALPDGWYIDYDQDGEPYYYTEGGVVVRQIPSTDDDDSDAN